MEKFIIEPHMRLYEWVAIEKGYFDKEGLEYELSEKLTKKDAQAELKNTEHWQQFPTLRLENESRKSTARSKCAFPN